MKSIREEILGSALALTTGPRARDYGDVLVNHARIAALWNVMLGPKLKVAIQPHEVALCMGLVKNARLVQTPDHKDSYDDGVAYIAIAGELVERQKNEFIDARGMIDERWSNYDEGDPNLETTGPLSGHIADAAEPDLFMVAKGGGPVGVGMVEPETPKRPYSGPAIDPEGSPDDGA